MCFLFACASEVGGEMVLSNTHIYIYMYISKGHLATI